MDAERPTVAVGDRTRDRKAETGTVTLRRAALGAAIEGMEDHFALVVWNAESLIVDPDLHDAASRAAADADAPLRRR